jgi:virulence factor Mce-like protein
MSRETTRELLLNIVAFVVVIGACGTYLATQAYHWNPLEKTRVAYLEVADTNLVLTGTGVFVSGVRIGQVSNVEIQTTGAKLELRYNAANAIPADSVVTIGLQSALGEPYLNITPGTAGGPTLPDGAQVSAQKIVEPQSIPGIFQQISTMSSVVAADPMAGILKTVSEALDGTGDSLNQISDGTKLVASLLISKSPQLRKMFSNTQIYTADLGWIITTLPQFSGGLRDIVVHFLGALDATGELVNRGNLYGAMTQSLYPFFQKLNPYLAEIIPNVMDAVGPLMPIATAVNDTVPQINMSEFLSQALQLFGAGDGVNLVITQPN